MKKTLLSSLMLSFMVAGSANATPTDQGTVVNNKHKATQTFQWSGTVPAAPTGTGYAIEKVAGSTDFNSGIIALKTNSTVPENADIQSSSSMSFRLMKSDTKGYANSFTVHLENFHVGIGGGLVNPVDKTAGIKLIATGDTSGQEVDLVDSKFDEYLVGAGTGTGTTGGDPAMATLSLESAADGIVDLGAGEQLIVQATILVDNISGDYTL